jgi:3-deoxy-D-manno-octulosonic-acid transferase
MLHRHYNTYNVVTFFSPSGYNHARADKTMHMQLYLPFDLPVFWRILFNLLKPDLLIIAKHDVWPAQIWTAKKENIPLYLINSSLPENSTRTRWYIKNFLKHVYREFTYICAISDEDKDRFSRHYPRCNVVMVGDTKYDQVVMRKKEAQNAMLLPQKWKANKWILVAGSIWPEDSEHLLPVLKKMLIHFASVSIIVVPHQPDDRTVEKYEQEFMEWKTCRFSIRDTISDERVLIVDAVGYLAAIYESAQAAYVGGSFKQGIHNVMEPAIYGIPVIFGPVHTNSYEAMRLAEAGGAIITKNEQEIEKNIIDFIQKEDIRIKTGQKAATFALENTGATEKLLELWKPILTRATD